jgi:hypothetical protein
MEPIPAIARHEAINRDEPLVHDWRVTQLTRLVISGLLAEGAASRVDWHEITLEIYDEALRAGDMLLQVLVPPKQRRRVAGLLQHHHVHDVGYFGLGTFEEFPDVDAN